MSTEKLTTHTLTKLSVEHINPLIAPDDPVETMARVARLLAVLQENLEEVGPSDPAQPGYHLILQCAIAALDLPMEIGRNDGTLPTLELPARVS